MLPVRRQMVLPHPLSVDTIHSSSRTVRLTGQSSASAVHLLCPLQGSAEFHQRLSVATSIGVT